MGECTLALDDVATATTNFFAWLLLAEKLSQPPQASRGAA
jgi:hypothetical protein